MCREMTCLSISSAWLDAREGTRKSKTVNGKEVGVGLGVYDRKREERGGKGEDAGFLLSHTEADSLTGCRRRDFE